MKVLSFHYLSLTYALADPDAQHVQLQQPVVHGLAVRVVHEQVVQEGAAPRRQRAQQVAQRQEPGAAAAPRQQARQHHQYVHEGHSCNKENKIAFLKIPLSEAGVSTQCLGSSKCKMHHPALPHASWISAK